MRFRLPNSASEFKSQVATALLGPHMLTFIPALCLAGFWFGGEAALVIIALSIPVLWALFGGFEGVINRRIARAAQTGLIAPDTFRLKRWR